MTTYRLRLRWGYWMFYAQHHFHHADYCWDGGITVEHGRIGNCAMIAYDGICGRFTPAVDRLTPLSEPRWRWFTRHTNYPLGGVLFDVEGTPDTIVHIRTRTADLDFSIRELQQQRHILKHIGHRYSHADLEVSFDGDDFRNWTAEDMEILGEQEGRWRSVVYAREFGAPITRIQLSDWAVVAPGATIRIPIPAPQWRMSNSNGGRAVRATLSTIARNLGGMAATVGYAIALNDQHIVQDTRSYQITGHADDEIVSVEELEAELPEELFQADGNVLYVTQTSGETSLVIGRIWLDEILCQDLEIAVCPLWAIQDEPFVIELLCRTAQDNVQASLPDGIRCLDELPDSLPAGNHRFSFVADQPLANAAVRFTSAFGTCEAVIEQVSAATPEPFPMQVGMDNVTFPATVPEKTHTLFKYMTDHQILDHYSFRCKPSIEVLRGWIEHARKYNIHYSIEHDSDPANVRDLDLAGDPLFTAGYRLTECDGPIFGYDQKPEISDPLVDILPSEQRTMRTAYEAFEEYWRELKRVKSDVFGPEIDVWGHVSTISHYVCFRANLSTCVTQLNKSHNTLLMSEARGSVRAAGRSMWATYIAEGAHVNPEGDKNLRMWWLSIYLSYIMGASIADDEQHLFRTWHEFLYGPHDRDSVIRIQMTKDFNRHVKTHPRRGDLQVRQAVLIGRYACDVADGLANPDGTPLRVWRNFGGLDDTWSPGEPEYGMDCIDKLFPGVWLQSLEQSPESIRRWYSGSPFGETELVSIDSKPEALETYGLLMLLGWNTMDEAQYGTLRQYVENGGTIFMAVPHATCNESRDFLNHGLEPLNLVHDGDFSDLFGVKVTGPGDRIRIIEIVEAERNPALHADVPIDTSAHFRRVPIGPDHEMARTAEIEMTGAEVLARDPDNGNPILVRHRFGKGEAYLLTTWAYPGNSWLRGFVTEIVAGLAENMPREVALEDYTGDVYYTVRKESDTGLTRIHLINTDWSSAENEKHCRLRLGDQWVDVTVREGRLSEVVWGDDIAILVESPNVFIDRVEAEGEGWTLTAHGYGEAVIGMRYLDTGCSDWEEVGIRFGESSIAKVTLPDRR